MTAERGRLRVVVTGAGGFVGRALVQALAADGHDVRGWRHHPGQFELDLDPAALIEAAGRWQSELETVDVLVHLAARVHQLGENQQAMAERYRRVNTDATLALAGAAQAAGVRRLVFVSTAKVYGEGAPEPYGEAAVPAPTDAYAQSKWAAEQGLEALAADTGLELVILRPPLVYGAGVGGNFGALCRLAATPWPLPLGAVCNRRDMIALDNLVDILVRCCSDARAAGGTFNVADAAPYTLAEIIGNLRAARGRPRRLWRLPAPLLAGAIRLLRGAGDMQRLLGDFRLDTRQVRQQLGWEPPLAMPAVLARMAGAPC